MSSNLNSIWQAIVRQATWRSIVRATGLGLMVYLVLTRQHPDASALVACATMIGLASFVQLIPQERDKLDPPRRKPPDDDPEDKT